MEKNLIVSIYFSTYKTFLTITERTESEFILHYLNSTSDAIDIKDISSEASIAGINEIIIMLSEYFDRISKLNVVISPEYVHITSFPGDINNISDDINDFLSLEINNAFENKTLNDFRINLAHLTFPSNTSTKMLIASLLPKEIENSLNTMFADYDLVIDEIYFSHLALINTFLFNYPEKIKENTSIICVHKDILEIILISNSNLISYEFVKIENESIGTIIEKKLQEIFFNSGITNIENLLLCGSNLTKDIFFECWETGSLLAADTKRLNPLRMFKSKLDERDKEYCSRVFHLFAACIGGSLPKYLKNTNV